MRDLLSIGTNRRESMIGTGIGLGLAGYRLRTSFEAMPSLDLQFADRRMISAVLGPTPSFSRASTGTYFDSQGVLRAAAVNGPRFNHTFNGTSWVSRGLLVEEQRTNSAQYSENLSNAYWTKAAVTISANTSNSPDGNATADKIVETAANAQHTLYNSGFSVTAGTAYTISFFAKAAGRNFIQFQSATTLSGASSGTINFDLLNGTLGTVSGTNTSAEIINVGDGWYRCVIKISSAASTGTGFLQFTLVNSATASFGQAYLGDGTSGVLFWGVQLEAGSAFATSYIPSLSNSSTTRSADVCQITGSDFSGFWNGTEGSVAAEFDYLNPVPSGIETAFLFNNTTSENERIWFSKASASPYGQRAIFTASSSNVAVLSVSDSLPSSNQFYKTAAGFKLNDFAATLNGASVVTDTSGAMPSVSQLSIGWYPPFTTGTYLNGHIARLRYYPTRLANAKLQELST